ncbi:MAG: hypothetical protein GY838_10845 [bacterium]|nr:hypothetical protein [bacterium]
MKGGAILKSILICLLRATVASAAEQVEIPLELGVVPRQLGDGSDLLLAFDAGDLSWSTLEAFYR